MSNTNLYRRTFLRGMGLSLGLPLLDAMAPRTARGGESNPGDTPVRMAFVFVPNGAIMQDWTPAATGSDYELSKTLSALADFQDDITVLTGLAQDNGRAKGDGPGDHARCASTFLTGAHPVKTDGTDIRVGVSVDQVAAAEIGHHTRLPSLELGIERGRNAGNCDSGYSCAYSSNISWKTATTPVAKEVHPRLVFERLFGAEDEADRSRAERDFYRKSILDLVANDAAQLQARLGQSDRRKIDEYFTSVRELEQRILRSEQSAAQARPSFSVPEEVPGELQEHIRLMYDLLVLAFRTDSTRVASFMVGNAGSNRSYRMVGVSEGHHELSHHGNEAEKMASIQKIDQFLADQFAYFLGQLKNTPDGERSLLDNLMILYGSGLGDANRHDHHNLPAVLAGRAGGTLSTGKHIKLEEETPMNNLFLSMLDRVGAEVAEIGDSSGRLSLLDA